MSRPQLLPIYFVLLLLCFTSTVTCVEQVSDATPSSLTGTYTFSAVPLLTSPIPIDELPNITAALNYEQSLFTASWNASVSTSISTANNSFTSTLSFSNPGYNSSALWDVCALTFAISPTYSNVSGPYYGSGNCSELFSERCLDDIEEAVSSSANFSHDRCGGTNVITFSSDFWNTCGSTWNVIGNNLTVQTYLNPIGNFATVSSTVQNANLMEVAMAAIYPVKFVEIFRPGANGTGSQNISPMVCMQAVNVTSEEANASGTTGSPTSTGPSSTNTGAGATTATAKSEAGHETRMLGFLGFLLFLSSMFQIF